MKKTILLIILIIVIALGAFYVYKNMEQKKVAPISDYKNISYIIDGTSVKLTDGLSETPAAPGSSSMVTTKYFGNEVFKDLNNDGREDVAFLITQESGGSGTFFYVVAALNTENGYVGSHAVLLGDRVAPQTTESGDGNSIVVNYMDHAAGEPMATRPSVAKSLRLILDPITMQFGEVDQNNASSSATTTSMSINMKTWNWEKTEYNDGKIVKPNKDLFTITFKDDGTFGATTDCNSLGGNYSVVNSKITFSNMISTLMHCDGSQEADFTKMLNNSGEYLFTSNGELVLNLKMDSGSVFFK